MDNNQNPKEFHLYSDIRERTGGEIYIGVVGLQIPAHLTTHSAKN